MSKIGIQDDDDEIVSNKEEIIKEEQQTWVEIESDIKISVTDPESGEQQAKDLASHLLEVKAWLLCQSGVGPLMAPLLAMVISGCLIDIATIHGCLQFEDMYGQGVCERDGTIGEGPAALRYIKGQNVEVIQIQFFGALVKPASVYVMANLFNQFASVFMLLLIIPMAEQETNRIIQLKRCFQIILFLNLFCLSIFSRKSESLYFMWFEQIILIVLIQMVFSILVSLLPILVKKHPEQYKIKKSDDLKKLLNFEQVQAVQLGPKLATYTQGSCFVGFLIYAVLAIIFGTGNEDKFSNWDQNQGTMILNLILLTYLFFIYMQVKSILVGTDGPQLPKLGLIKQCIERTKNTLAAIQKVPEYKKFLLSCLFHRQASNMWSNIIIPLIKFPEMKISDIQYLAGAGGLFLFQALGPILWRGINNCLNLGSKKVICLNQLKIAILSLWVQFLVVQTPQSEGRNWVLVATVIFSALMQGPLNGFTKSMMSDMTPKGQESGYGNFYYVVESGCNIFSIILTLLVTIVSKTQEDFMLLQFQLLFISTLSIILVNWINLKKGQIDKNKMDEMNADVEMKIINL